MSEPDPDTVHHHVYVVPYGVGAIGRSELVAVKQDTWRTGLLGGEVEIGESWHAALSREVCEETGLNVTIDADGVWHELVAAPFAAACVANAAACAAAAAMSAPLAAKAVIDGPFSVELRFKLQKVGTFDCCSRSGWRTHNEVYALQVPSVAQFVQRASANLAAKELYGLLRIPVPYYGAPQHISQGFRRAWTEEAYAVGVKEWLEATVNVCGIAPTSLPPHFEQPYTFRASDTPYFVL